MENAQGVRERAHALCHNRRVDFVGELEAVREFLDERGFRSAVIGGKLPGVSVDEARGYFLKAGLDDKWRELTNER